MKPIPDINAFIAALAADTKAALETKSASALAALTERRQQLLAQHLGFEPERPIEPVYVLGDSHTLFFAGEDGFNQTRHRRVGFWRPRYIMRGLDLLPCFHTRHLGPGTAWRAFDYGSSTRTREKIDALAWHELKPGARVLLSFGEIDCRCHLPRIALENKPVAPAVQENVARFMQLVKHLQSRELQVAVWGPAMITTAAVTTAPNPLPTVGSFELRTEITRRYAVELARACDSVKAGCVCLAGTYHDWAQPAAADCFIDGCHLAQKMMPQVLNALGNTGILRLPTKQH